MREKPRLTFNEFCRALGPGLMTAAAAIGGSHLVSSTRAGADLGWQLILFILAIHFLKYPFFHFGIYYTALSGESLIHGYRRLGKASLYIYFALVFIGAITSLPALALLSASLSSTFIPSISIQTLSLIWVVVTTALLFNNHFSKLNFIVKVIIVLFTSITIVAVLFAWDSYKGIPPSFISPTPWQPLYLGFLVALMGWMPAPLEVTSIASLWLISKGNEEKEAIGLKAKLADMSAGYIFTAIIAIVFIALGALILHGTGERFSPSGAVFSQQLINLYTKTIGPWSYPIIALAAFLCIFSSLITCFDGYSRAIAVSLSLFRKRRREECWREDKTLFQLVLATMTLFVLVILMLFRSSMGIMLSFAMTCAFVTTPFLAYLNHKLVFKKVEKKPGTVLYIWSIVGLIYLVLFLILFLWWRLTG